MTGHPIDPFLAVWSSRGGRDGIDLRLRLYRALSADRPWTREHLRRVLRTLLPGGAEERARFERCFDEFFHETEVPDWLRERLDAGLDGERALTELRIIEAPPPVNPPIPLALPSIIPPQSFWRVASGVLALVAAMGLGGWGASRVLRWMNSRPHPIIPITHTDASALTADTSRTDTLPTDASIPGMAPVGEAQALVEDDHPVRVGSYPPPSAETPRVLFAALGIAALLTLVDVGSRAWSIRRMKPRPLPAPPRYRADTAAERSVDLRAREPLPSPLDDEALDQLAVRTGFALDPALPKLDLTATVQATARGGGLLETVYRPARRPATLCVARPPKLDAVAAAVVDAFVSGLTARGVHVAVVKGLPDDSAADLHLVILDASRWRQRETEAWRRIPHVAYLEARDPARWDNSVARLPFGVFPLDAQGLLDALDAARTEHIPSPRVDLGADQAIEQLGRAFPLGAAGAMVGSFDLPTIDRLRRLVAPALPFLAIQRVLALEGVTTGPTSWTMTPSLRAWFDSRVLHDSSLRETVLAWQSEQLMALHPPSGSRAELEVQMRRLLVDLARGPRDVTAWVSQIDQIVADPTMRAIFDAQFRAMPKRPITDVIVDQDHERLVELGVVDPTSPPSQRTWIRLGIAALGALLLGAGTITELARTRVPTLMIWGGAWSDSLGSRRSQYAIARCEGVAVLTGFGEDGSPVCTAPVTTESAMVPSLTDRRAGLTTTMVLSGAGVSPNNPLHGEGMWPVATTPPVRVESAASSRRSGQFADVLNANTRCPSGSAVVGVSGEWVYAAEDFRDGVIERLDWHCGTPKQVRGPHGVVQWSATPSNIAMVSRPGPGRFSTPLRLDCLPEGFVRSIRLDYDYDLRGVAVECAEAQMSP